jgi:hypothetical protein
MWPRTYSVKIRTTEPNTPHTISKITSILLGSDDCVRIDEHPLYKKKAANGKGQLFTSLVTIKDADCTRDVLDRSSPGCTFRIVNTA